VKVAAVQLEPRLADVAANLEMCERLADEAAAAGAEWILLPEFFTTGMGFLDELPAAALRPDGEATALLSDLARRHGATVGGSFICRDADGEARNAFFLALPDGRIAGRHDKDIPTMWENATYVGGSDDGVIQAGEVTVGAAVCWEFMRTQTARRLRGRVDLVVGGSCWWSLPHGLPRVGVEKLEEANERQATSVAPAMARYVGAPVVHAAHCGDFECRTMPPSPFPYRGHFEGGASIADARGRVLAFRDRRDGPGLAVADVEPGRVEPELPVPDRFWLHRRAATAATAWAVQGEYGRRRYERHGRGLPPLVLDAERRVPEVPAVPA
jgi:predicted amidohydrolase